MLAALAGLGSIWALDGLNSFAQEVRGTGLWYATTNTTRLISGAACGVALGALLYPILQYALWRDRDHRRVLEKVRQLAFPLGSAMAVSLAMLFWTSAAYAPMVILAAGSTAVALTLVNGAIVALVVHGSGRATHWAQAVPFAVAGVILSLVETGAMALLRRVLQVT